MAVVCVSLVACQTPSGVNTQVEPSPVDEPVPWDEPISRQGNPLKYSVFGVEYQVLPTARGYAESGIASWYGPGFHGKLTSNGEVYDMNAISAAHKSLPLPTYARVKNLENGKEVVVRINDRGPFSKNRIIDLSYAAAMRLDMIQQGTAKVEVTAITSPAVIVAAKKAQETSNAPLPKQVQPNEIRVSVQVGAFSAPVNAQNLQKKLVLAGFSEAVVVFLEDGTPAPHKVRLPGPEEVNGLNQLIERLVQSGFAPVHTIVER